MKNLKRLISLTIIICIAFSCVGISAISVTSIGACVMDFESGEILYQKNGDTPYVPASMTKVMTLFLVFERLYDGRLTKETPVIISKNAAHLSVTGDAMNIPLTKGAAYTVEDLINAMALPSACASCTAIAEHIAGTEADFVKLMNLKAIELGLSAYFTDTSGLSNDNRITANSMAKLVKIFIEKYPDILNYTSKTSANIKGRTVYNTNSLLPGKSYYYKGADGFKTGTTSAAGCCLVATAERNGTRIITVTMRSTSGYARYSDTKAMLNEGFSKMEYLTGNIFSTDMRGFINGSEIPAYCYMGRTKALLITAEDLRNYGFSVNYIDNIRILYLEFSGSEITPLELPTDKTIGNPVFKVYPTDIKIVAIKDGESYPLSTVYAIDGRCMISIDELGRIYGYTFDNETRAAYVSAAISD